MRILVHKNPDVFEHVNVEPIEGDLLKKDTLTEFIDGAEIVIHLAGVITLEKKSVKVLEVNIDGTRNL